MRYHPIAGRKFTRWPSVYFLAGISLIAVIGTPVYIFFLWTFVGRFFLFAGMSAATLIAITAGYHRLYAHKTYQASRIYQFLMLGFGAASLQQSALKWTSLHRSHHQHVDTDKDPYNIKKGFFYAHRMDSFWIRKIDFSNVKDLKQNKLVMHQHRHFQIWAFMFGVVLPLIIGFLSVGLGEAVIFGIFLRLFVVFQVTFFINSFAHTYGTQKYSNRISARDNWLGALLTFGEGYHSFHHQFSNDYRNGHKWFHWDPSKWFIRVNSLFGWTWDLKRTPENKIAEAGENL